MQKETVQIYLFLGQEVFIWSIWIVIIQKTETEF